MCQEDERERTAGRNIVTNQIREKPASVYMAGTSVMDTRLPDNTPFGVETACA